MPTATFQISGKSTGRGAFVDATVIRPDGSIYEPDRTESSRTGRHRQSWWYAPTSDCLILVTDISNSGKDNSYTHEPETLTPAQQAATRTFKEDHYID